MPYRRSVTGPKTAVRTKTKVVITISFSSFLHNINSQCGFIDENSVAKDLSTFDRLLLNNLNFLAKGLEDPSDDVDTLLEVLHADCEEISGDAWVLSHNLLNLFAQMIVCTTALKRC